MLFLCGCGPCRNPFVNIYVGERKSLYQDEYEVAKIKNKAFTLESSKVSENETIIKVEFTVEPEAPIRIIAGKIICRVDRKNADCDSDEYKLQESSFYLFENEITKITSFELFLPLKQKKTALRASNR